MCQTATETRGDGASTSERGQEKQAYGTYGNVYLTPAQYKALTETEDIPPAYIDRFSARLEAGNYHPADHAATIRAWWAKDRDTFLTPTSGGGAYAPKAYHPEYTESTFDVDDFFRDAVRRTMDRWGDQSV